MDDLMIFSSVLNWVLLALIVLIHIGAAILSAVSRYKLYTDSAEIFKLLEVGALILEAVGIALHLIILCRGLLAGARAEEILLVLLISACAGLLSIAATDKFFNKEEKRKG